MKIKKKDLRKRLAQLPINYPDPTVTEDGVPGGHLNLEDELTRVELLCRRLAHNEVVVRDACLAELPKYIAAVTAAVAKMETEYEKEADEVLQYFRGKNKPTPYHYDNIMRALKVFREKEFAQEQRKRRRESLKEYKKKKREEKREKEMAGKFGVEQPSDDEEEEEEEEEVHASPDSPLALHRERYHYYMRAWCDLELVYLKLCRGLHFCLWHSDKPLVQLACAQQIADLLLAVPTRRTKMLFYACLFRVLSREWPTIDRYRLDKYLALVRKMWAAWVKLMREVGEEKAPSPAPSKKSSSAAAGKTKATRTKAAPAAAKGKKRARGQKDPARSVEKVAMDISLRFITEAYQESNPSLHQTLSELFFVFQEYIFPNKNSVGLSMHLCDVAFDEINKAFLTPTLFVAISAGVPLFAMSQGNYVEKRVLDFFFPPIVGGVLLETRKEQITLSMKRAKATIAPRGKGATTPSRKTPVDAALAERMAAEQVNEIVGSLIEICREYSVSLGTVRSVRVMFSEAMQVMQQVLRPDEFEELTERDLRRRVKNELGEVAETRNFVKEMRTAMKEERRGEQRARLMEKIKERKKKAKETDEKVDEKQLLKQMRKEEKQPTKKKNTRDTKRKKNYTLTTEDLYGDERAVNSDDD
ncbi:Nucleolar protein,Nop52, putative [Angomonas deanei]|uniref:Nucleolar protein,Nop52, putative n=1 Tax=Angomonas deanei TaxID=59799 RepID=A0A7G2C4A7_9TRYP|nr:Nucleolar protein,Nop52, putative [Angomonas deanei]